MKHNFQGKYKNVFIRQIEERDIEEIRRWRNKSSNTKYLRKLPYITKEMQMMWYEHYLNNTEEMMFAIEETEELHRMVGSFSLYNFTENQVEFGKILIGNNKAHGKHVGTNALKWAVNFAFQCLKKERVILHVYAENSPAVKIYERAE